MPHPPRHGWRPEKGVSTSKLLGALAKAVIATMVGGPIAGGQTAANEAVDLLTSWLGGERMPAYQAVLAEVVPGLERLARSEQIGEVHLEQGMTQAREVVLRHGLSAGEIVAHDLVPERVAAAVLSRSAADLEELDEPARELCRRAVQTVYAVVLSRPNALPELQRAFQQATLTRLAEVRHQPGEVLLAIRGALAAASAAARRRPAGCRRRTGSGPTGPAARAAAPGSRTCRVRQRRAAGQCTAPHSRCCAAALPGIHDRGTAGRPARHESACRPANAA
jgi:hypothetical protein